jgi:hypothetical protein
LLKPGGHWKCVCQILNKYVHHRSTP